MFRKLDAPATWDNVRPGCIIEYRGVGARRTRFYRADRLTLADCPTNDSYRWIFGATVRKNGSPSTSREATRPCDAAQFMPERELVAIYVDVNAAHAEAVMPPLSPEPIVLDPVEVPEVEQDEPAPAAPVEQIDAAHLDDRWDNFLACDFPAVDLALLG
jgi:hypothetical protein